MGKWIFSGLVMVVGALMGSSDLSFKVLCEGFLPPNNLSIPVGSKLADGITEGDFNSVLDRIQDLYGKEFMGHDAVLVINRNWEDGTVNAYATQDGKNWAISMFGGLARYKGMTYDGFAAVACHEIGHHIGGAPTFSDMNWGSVEGEADYYATLKCLRRLFEKDDNETIVAGLKVDPLAEKTCNEQFSNHQDALVCIRGVMAGVVLGSILQSLGGGNAVHLDTPDPKMVNSTYEAHPRAQCRLDTYFQGQLCTVAVADELSHTDYQPGSCYDKNATPRGLRPRCWFKP